MSARARLRIDESVGEARAFRDEVAAWRRDWDAIDALGSHLTQLDLLAGVILGLTDAIAARAQALDDRKGVGETYDECRAVDRRLLHARRLWRWYADKLDQRAGREDPRIHTLRAADEIIWSCWKTSFTALDEPVPAAPIAYLAAEHSASATPRTDFPPGLRPGADDLLKEHLERLPVPVIGLPPVCVRRPWWLILAAHETGHHVQFEVPGLEERTRQALPATWRPWGRELFADAFSVLLTGGTAIWAVRELETRPAAAMDLSPSPAYPPPALRLAVMNAVAGLPADPRDERVPPVAAALRGILRDLARPADSGVIERWRAALTGPDEPVAHPSLDAARLCAAAGVAAWREFADADAGTGAGEPERLAARLRALLPRCAEPGTRAASAAPPSAAAIAGEFLSDLERA